GRRAARVVSHRDASSSPTSTTSPNSTGSPSMGSLSLGAGKPRRSIPGAAPVDQALRLLDGLGRDEPCRVRVASQPFDPIKRLLVRLRRGLDGGRGYLVGAGALRPLARPSRTRARR